MDGFNEALYEMKVLNEKIDDLHLGMRNVMPQPRLQYFILHICDHCNLNCAGCNHLSCLATPKFIDKEVLMDDMKRLHQIHGEVPRIGIMGGEPLLHPQLCDILKGAREIFRHSRLLLSTNGVLCRKQGEDFWRLCKELDITVRFTRYPIKVDYDAIVDKLQRYGISVDFFASDTNSMSEFQSIALNIEGECDPVESFCGCIFANRCTVVSEGKIYVCPIVQNAHFFSNAFGCHIGLEQGDYIDIYKHSEEEILHYLSKPIPFCRFCDVKKRKEMTFAWRISGNNPYEWCDFTFNEYDIRYIRNRNVYVYGAGNWGEKAVLTLIQNGISIKGIIVSDLSNNPSNVNGIDVHCIDDIRFQEGDFCIVAVYSNKSQKEMQIKLINSGVNNFAILSKEPQ